MWSEVELLGVDEVEMEYEYKVAVADLDVDVEVEDEYEVVVADIDVDVEVGSTDNSTQYPLYCCKWRGQVSRHFSVVAFRKNLQASQYCAPAAAHLFKQASLQLFGIWLTASGITFVPYNSNEFTLTETCP